MMAAHGDHNGTPEGAKAGADGQVEAEAGVQGADDTDGSPPETAVRAPSPGAPVRRPRRPATPAPPARRRPPNALGAFVSGGNR
jgi:hypothetical protein